MSRIVFKGRARHMAQSYIALSRISMQILARRLIGRGRHPGGGLAHEIGIRFWRHQFSRALRMGDIAQGRAYLDSLQTHTGEIFDVTRAAPEPGGPAGCWITPDRTRRDQVLLYFHGGGYTFDAYTSDVFADLLAHDLGARLFQLEYRLTPEHPHPAQIDDALAACRYLLDRMAGRDLVLIGDSAGGHLVLMTLLALRDAGLPQPALAVGLCPWTDIGDRGASLHANDRFDLVSGWMALKFGDFLSAGKPARMRCQLSPICHDFNGLAPIYLQGGGHEVLIDMIRDFARMQARNGARVCLDVWPQMTHDFFGYGRTHPDSAEALERIGAAMDAVAGGGLIGASRRTEIHAP